MWNFFRRDRAKTRDRSAASRDAYSLGNMLLKTGMINADQLREALDYQEKNPEFMLGKTLSKLGYVDEEVIEAILQLQEARPGKPSRKHIGKIIELAKNHKKPLHDAHDRMQGAAMCLTGK